MFLGHRCICRPYGRQPIAYDQANESARGGEGAELGGIGSPAGAVCFVLAGRVAGHFREVGQGAGLGQAAWVEMGARASLAGIIDKAIVCWRILEWRASFVH